MLEIIACILATVILCIYGPTNLYLLEYEYQPNRIKPYKQKYLAATLYLIGITEQVTKETARSTYFKCAAVQVVTQVAFVLLISTREVK